MLIDDECRVLMRGSALTQANFPCCLNCRCKLNPRSKHRTLERDILKNDTSKCVHDNSSQHLIFTASWRGHRVALQVGAHRWVVVAGWAVTGSGAFPQLAIVARYFPSSSHHTTQQYNELASRASLPPDLDSEFLGRPAPSNGSGTWRPLFPIKGTADTTRFHRHSRLRWRGWHPAASFLLRLAFLA